MAHEHMAPLFPRCAMRKVGTSRPIVSRAGCTLLVGYEGLPFPLHIHSFSTSPTYTHLPAPCKFPPSPVVSCSALPPRIPRASSRTSRFTHAYIRTSKQPPPLPRIIQVQG